MSGLIGIQTNGISEKMFLKEVNFEKNQQMAKKHTKIPSMQHIKLDETDKDKKYGKCSEKYENLSKGSDQYAYPCKLLLPFVSLFFEI